MLLACFFPYITLCVRLALFSLRLFRFHFERHVLVCSPLLPSPLPAPRFSFPFRCNVHIVIARLKYSKMTVSVSISSFTASLSKCGVLHILSCLPHSRPHNPRIQNLESFGA